VGDADLHPLEQLISGRIIRAGQGLAERERIG
jgi:hypothetical protein